MPQVTRLAPYAGQESPKPRKDRRIHRKGMGRFKRRLVEYRAELQDMAPRDAILAGQRLGMTLRSIAYSSGYTLHRIQHEVTHWLGRAGE